MGLEGIVSKRLGSTYRSGRTSDWLKFKNPNAPAVKREAEEEWSCLRLDQLAPTMGVESWIIMASGAFLLSLCFLVSFIAADAWMSRQPISLRSICSSVLELYESRGEITYNEKWQQEFSRLRNDCAVALSTKYSPTGTR
jgi:hypothetical protein